MERLLGDLLKYTLVSLEDDDSSEVVDLNGRSRKRSRT